MSNPLPSVPPVASQPIAVPVESASVWERITTWASENKAVVYTIAGVAVVVTGAGAVYYFNSVRLLVRPLLLPGSRRHIFLPFPSSPVVASF